MGFVAMIDALLRDPNVVYEMALSGEKLGKLCGRLLLIFAITAGLYGATMGSFRWLHPEYRFRDFEIATVDGDIASGRIAGVSTETGTAYAQVPLADADYTHVRFNLSHPTDWYAVDSVEDEAEYTAIRLAPDSALSEAGAWRMPWLALLKVPALFLLTLLVCAPSLYVLNLALDARMHFMPVMTTASFGLAATGVMLAVIAPIAGLFSYVTESYHFMQCMHVCVFAVAGVFGMRIMYRGLLAMIPDGGFRVHAMMVLCLMLYGLVGSQLAWTLKPFLGTPYLPATPPFRVESGNIYVSFFGSMGRWTSVSDSSDTARRALPLSHPSRETGAKRPTTASGRVRSSADERVRVDRASAQRDTSRSAGGRSGDPPARAGSGSE